MSKWIDDSQRGIPPILLRLSFRVPPERMAEFETVYQKKIAPFLLKHGLVESSERGRRIVEGVFSRLFEVETLAEVKEKAESLRGDPAWHEMLQSLGSTLGLADADGLIPYHLYFYIVPPVPGTVVNAGQGRGCWRTFDGSNGLPDNWVHWILQDRNGSIWFATESGVSRYDGKTWTTFTTADGLTHNMVYSINQDREGNLWFGAWDGGVSRYDGRTFTNFTLQDRLEDDSLLTMFIDSRGKLWVGSSFAVLVIFF